MMGTEPRETVLLAVTGTSPAIITETIWALAQESPPVLPHRVVVVTTTVGRDRIGRDLFESSEGDTSIWQSLLDELEASGHDLAGRLRFGPIPAYLRVFTTEDDDETARELDDIRTPEDNTAAADFLLEQLRQFTENPDIRVIASLAGGRKTMSALLYAAMSLLAHERDWLTHVLVREPFESPALRPRFYFPTRSVTRHALHDWTGDLIREVEATSHGLQLADIPFVRLRHLFARDFDRLPGHFHALIERGSRSVRSMASTSLDALPVMIAFEPERETVQIDGHAVRLHDLKTYAYLAWLVDRRRRGLPPQKHLLATLDDFREWLPRWCATHDEAIPQLRYLALDWELPGNDDSLQRDLRRVRSRLKEKLRKRLPDFLALESGLLRNGFLDITREIATDRAN